MITAWPVIIHINTKSCQNSYPLKPPTGTPAIGAMVRQPGAYQTTVHPPKRGKQHTAVQSAQPGVCGHDRPPASLLHANTMHPPFRDHCSCPGTLMQQLLHACTTSPPLPAQPNIAHADACSCATSSSTLHNARAAKHAPAAQTPNTHTAAAPPQPAAATSRG